MLVSKMNLEILRPEDRRWIELYRRLPAECRDVFYSDGYARASQATINKRDKVLCAVFDNDDEFLIYPFAVRKISNFCPGVNDYNDVISLYGRGGAVTNIKDRSVLNQFHNEFESFCRKEGIICSFDRYHPLIENHSLAAGKAKIFNMGGFVVADLRPPIEDIERNFMYMQRKSIKKAEKTSVRVFYERNLDHIEDFLKIYTSTLDRNMARKFYYFEKKFYEKISEELPDNFVFFYAAVDNTVVSCELLLFEGLYCHSFLGGTLKEYMDKCPNSILKREIMRYFKERGCYFYLLGGGQKPHDNIYKYKLSFAPQGEHVSFVGGTIFNENAYCGLKETLKNSGIQVNKDRFQFYDPT